ncbi:MAG: glucose 1-dehydrogenase [Pseudomonadota bacterium]
MKANNSIQKDSKKIGMEKAIKRLKYDFDGKVALVTGAGSGIGREIAISFARQGAAVVVTDTNLEGVKETVRSIKKERGEAIHLLSDVTVEEDVRGMVAFAVDQYGGLDFACNNAGIAGLWAPIEVLPKDNWDRVLAVNLTGVYLCLRYELNQMLKQGCGAIVNIASVAGVIGSPGLAAYVASKHGIVGLTKTAALEVADKGIRVNAIAPGIVDAGFTKSSPKEFVNGAIGVTPSKRMASAAEIVSAVLWLCSSEASFILGQTLMVDGGMTVQ